MSSKPAGQQNRTPSKNSKKARVLMPEKAERDHGDEQDPGKLDDGVMARPTMAPRTAETIRKPV